MVNLVRTINIVIIIVASLFIKQEYNKIKYFYDVIPRRCVIAAKDIRQYNATPGGRSVDLQYNNVFICQVDGTILKINVSDDLYYSKNVGDAVWFDLSLWDIHKSMPNNENIPFVFGCVLLSISIIAIFPLKTWNLFYL